MNSAIITNRYKTLNAVITGYITIVLHTMIIFIIKIKLKFSQDWPIGIT